jgi:hypothetical protein
MYKLGLLKTFLRLSFKIFKEICTYVLKRLDPDPVELFRIRPGQGVPDLTGAGYIPVALHWNHTSFFLLWNVATCRLIDCWVPVTVCFVFPCA